MSGVDPKHRMDHVVVVMFENRSFDNLLGYLYEPGEVASFEGVAGRNLSNPIPDYAPDSHLGVVAVHPAKNMNTPKPDPGEEYQHVNTQLFRTVSPPDNRFKLAEAMTAPFNAPDDPARQPTMDGFVTDYINAFHAETGRMPKYDEYAQIMACYTPEMMPVLSTLARGFACFDHWFCEVPSQTFTNRSFFHAASASGFVVNAPYDNFPVNNTAETIFERLEAAGVPWRVYGDPDMRVSFTGLIHASRLSPFFKTHFSSIHDFYEDAERGTLPAYAFIEPNMMHGHNDMHPPVNALFGGLSVDPPSSLLGGEDYIDSRTVVNEEFRSTSLIRTLRERWSLGGPLTARDAIAADIAPILKRETPRPPEDWPDVVARPVPTLADTLVRLDRPLPPLGKYLLGTALAFEKMMIGHTPEINVNEATGREALAYFDQFQAATFPGIARGRTV